MESKTKTAGFVLRPRYKGMILTEALVLAIGASACPAHGIHIIQSPLSLKSTLSTSNKAPDNAAGNHPKLNKPAKALNHPHARRAEAPPPSEEELWKYSGWGFEGDEPAAKMV